MSRRTTVFETEPLGIEELWTHTSECAALHKRARGYQICSVRYDRKQTEVCQTGLSSSVDEDISLDTSNPSEGGE